MNYFYNLENDFLLESLNDKMLLKSNIIDFNNRNTNNFNNCNKSHSNSYCNLFNDKSNDKSNANDKSNDSKEIDFFYPKEKDTLFWCYYINKYGIEEFNYNKCRGFTIEHNIKIDIIEKIKTMKDILKLNKIKKIQVEDELMNQNKIGIQTLKTLMLIDKTNIIIVKKYCYQKIIFDREKLEFNLDNYKVIYSNNNNYFVDIKNTNKNLLDIINSRYEIDDLIKPLKSISSYKLIDLQSISNKLHISLYNSDGKSKTKQKLYEE